MLNKQASEFTECSEFENLLLDAVDACRKDVAKRHTDTFATKHQQMQMSQLKETGVSGQMLMDGVCTRKENLIYLFEQIFGKQRMKE